MCVRVCVLKSKAIVTPAARDGGSSSRSRLHVDVTVVFTLCEQHETQTACVVSPAL